MIELLDPQVIDPIAFNQGVLADIHQYSLLPDKRIGWNYCMDYTWLFMRCANYLKPDMVIIDIGCGPGAIHGYLEHKYGVNIIGIDLNIWEKDYVDIVGDFSDSQFRKEHGFNEESIDCIISTSAFEHNKPKRHHRLVNICMECLKPGGRLITTFAATKNKTRYFKKSQQWNLSAKDIKKIYGENIINFNEYDDIWQRWHNHSSISNDYKKRYGYWGKDDPTFVSIGADIVKA